MIEPPPRPWLVAVLTALCWNLVPLALLIAGEVRILSSDQGDDSRLIQSVAHIVAVGGGAVLCVAAASGAGMAALLARRRVRVAGSERLVTAGDAVGLGTYSAILGWMIALVALMVFRYLLKHS